MEAGDQLLVHTPFVSSGYWSPCAPLVWDPVKAPDIHFSFSHFRKQHFRCEKADTGQPSIGHHMGPLETGQIYSGGSCEVFSHLIGARGKDVLYVGDHVYGDILKSKKTVGWRTYLIIPELANEIYVWKKKKSLFDELQKIDNNLETIYRLVN
ncbi:unnamed protein product [Schistosoma margrebowiei]|uniref:Uncharacterized protein n=1 Tax=Schistosoma margrebowiei TaxID=48269 RepID=A0A183N5P4_9TREM|nr:unnamed protein product [Schistosoma margrebowiei]